jgi:hypothetical protein
MYCYRTVGQTRLESDLEILEREHACAQKQSGQPAVLDTAEPLPDRPRRLSADVHEIRPKDQPE